jgi:hypothetical protein
MCVGGGATAGGHACQTSRVAVAAHANVTLRTAGLPGSGWQRGQWLRAGHAVVRMHALAARGMARAEPSCPRPSGARACVEDSGPGLSASRLGRWPIHRQGRERARSMACSSNGTIQHSDLAAATASSCEAQDVSHGEQLRDTDGQEAVGRAQCDRQSITCPRAAVVWRLVHQIRAVAPMVRRNGPFAA